MDLKGIDVSHCRHPRKQVSEGLCLSYDLLRGLCLETMQPCTTLPEQEPGDDPDR